MNKLFAAALLSSAVAFSAQAQDVTGTIHASQGTQKINREIYGQFAEHLGSCIYGGLWVGPSPQGPQGSSFEMARRMLRRRVPLDGRNRSA